MEQQKTGRCLLARQVRVPGDHHRLHAAGDGLGRPEGDGHRRGGGGDAGGGEEQTEFDVVLTAHGDKKIQVIKEVRAITGLGLKEETQSLIRDLVRSAPLPVVTDADALTAPGREPVDV